MIAAAKAEEDTRYEYMKFESDSDSIRRIRNEQCGFTKKLCNEIYQVRNQHLAVDQTESILNLQCKSKHCKNVATTIVTSTPPIHAKPLPDGENTAYGYVIYGEKVYVETDLYATDDKQFNALRSHMVTWNAIARLNDRRTMACSFQIMTNEDTLDRKCYGRHSNPPKQKLTYAITLMWRQPMCKKIVQFIVDTYYPGSSIVSLW